MTETVLSFAADSTVATRSIVRVVDTMTAARATRPTELAFSTRFAALTVAAHSDVADIFEGRAHAHMVRLPTNFPISTRVVILSS
eukprot:CAMPEP_0171678846 /NCGR_PEP_ID=MMETSP0990-20121206/55901_1 /TAXON_ID=483369 /ORGANISM="non described non described, Strain CCMP2098" /LENGTH=84 /DNA_ID=CAMNT_0012265551 /DNA_START=80 /DNA_END=334 /DNA_ORIENTATION=+